MSGHPQEGHYDEGYSPQPHGTDSYYHDDQAQGYYDQHQDYQNHDDGQHHDYSQQQGGGGYYDEA